MNSIPQTTDVFNRHVQEYMNRFMNLDLYRASFDAFLERLPQEATLIDMGCGPGNVIKYLASQRTDLQCMGIDLAPEMIREAAKQNPGISFAVMDMLDACQLNREFQALVAAFCLPYVQRPAAPSLFSTFSRLMARGGLLYLSCMEGPATRSGFEKTSFSGTSEIYINYYPRKEIESLLHQNCFRILDFQTIDYPEADGSTTKELVYIAEKQPAL